MAAESSKAKPALFVDDSEALAFQEHKFATYYLWVVLHELLGHGTGKMMRQDSQDIYNFDPGNPPTNPLTGKPISCWYRPGQTWTGVFGNLATTVDECRAELVGAYLMDDVELLGLFGFTEHSEITCGDSEFIFSWPTERVADYFTSHLQHVSTAWRGWPSRTGKLQR